jgi:thioredoxin 1
MAVGAVFIAKQRPPHPSQEITVRPEAKTARDTPAPLPRLVDLGSDRCQSCLAMVPVLEALTEEYAGRLDVVFIDVWKEQSAADRYGIQLIPTQIFFDGSGKELFRHEGFFSKEDILSKWGDLGHDFGG